MRIGRRQLIGAGPALLLAPGIALAAGDPVAAGPGGRWRGLREHGVAVFRGIRYGADTSRARFAAAVAPPPSRAIVAAQQFGPSCPQRGGGDLIQREDCLFLNVWTPGVERAAKRPVMVYFHGGAYSGGTVIDPQIDGRHLAAQEDVVVVTVNHRLNALGYLYLARLDPRFPDSGNAGQLDLILALKWIRDNIAGFGGDPARIMVFGQSGGGAKIATLMGTPAAKGLFHAAATMSGQQVTASGPLNATRRAEAFLTKLKARPGDLIEMPVQRLIEGLEAVDPILGGGLYMGPVLDMKWLTRHPFWPDANPQGNSIPLILGNTHDETRAFIDPEGPTARGLNWSNLAEVLAPQLRIDAHPEWVIAQYRSHFPGIGPTDLFYDATTSARSWRGQVIEAEARAAAEVPAWVYRFDYVSPQRSLRRAAHTDDIPFVFGTLDSGDVQVRRLSAAMMGAFAALARNGDPTHVGLPRWPHHRLPARETMIFDTIIRVERDPRGWQRELFSRFPYIQPGT